jgi:hypothetical protein
MIILVFFSPDILFFLGEIASMTLWWWSGLGRFPQTFVYVLTLKRVIVTPSGAELRNVLRLISSSSSPPFLLPSFLPQILQGVDCGVC